MYKHFSNHTVNAYWEAKLPKGFQKPGPSASSMDVQNFITDKYIHKKYIDTKLGADPSTLYWNDRKKFDRFIKKLKNKKSAAVEDEEEESDEDFEKKKKDKKKDKKKRKDKDESEEDMPKHKKPSSEAGKLTKPVTGKTITSAVSIGDLISFEAPVSHTLHHQHSAPPQTGFDGFSEFQDAKLIDDFSDF